MELDKLICLADVMDNPDLYREPPAVVNLIAWQNRLTLLAGREKEGKSTLVAAAAAAITRGKPFLDQEMALGKVLWVSYEEPIGDIGRRFLNFGGDESLLFCLMHPEHPYESVKTYCEIHDFEFIVWDSLARIADKVSKAVPDPGNAPMWTRIIAPILDIAHDNATSALLHHSKKDGRGYRDSTGIGAAPDVIIEMKKVRGKPTQRFLDRKGRFGFSEDVISLEDGEYVIVEKVEMDKRVLAFVKKNPGCSKSALREGITGNNTEIGDMADKLLKDGAITNEGTASKHSLHLFSLSR